MKSKFLAFLLFVIAAGTAFANGGPGSPAPVRKTKTWDKTLMLRVKPEFRASLTKKGINHPQAAGLFAKLGVQKCFARFPHRQAPRQLFHFTGERIPDMTLIYQLHYTSDVTLFEAARLAMNTGLFEYAEPKYIRETTLVPNDPRINQQYYLDSVQAYQAWDITQGDTNVVVGISDSGVQTDHEDLVNQIKIDGSDPANGVDDNNDGKIDNYRGWDFCGPTFDPNYEGDNDPNITQGGASHGTHVAGISAAETFNGKGIAGVAYKCKIMPLKCAPDDAGGNIFYGMESIEYGAFHGASVINCSWGGPGGYSIFEQEVITDATLTFGTLVVAAAGNDNSPDLFYPAYYDHVLAVSALGTGNRRANFTNYNYKVRVGAPGVNIMSTYFDNTYLNNSGTSMASPVVAGVAALVRSKFPLLTPDQVAQRIRVTSDDIYSVQGNGGTTFFGKYGRGIVNAFRAVTENAPGVKNVNVRITDGNNNIFQPGDTLYITGDWTNLLDPTTPNLKLTFSVVSGAGTPASFVTAIPSTSVYTLGTINTNEIKNNNGSPFKIFLRPNLPVDRVLDIRMRYDDGTYFDYDHYSIVLNPTYLNVEKNNISTTLTSRARIGFNDDASTEGLGVKHKGRQTLYELGLMSGTSSSKMASTVRSTINGTTPTYDDDYRSLSNIKEIPVPGGQTFQYNNLVNDANAGGSATGVQVFQRSYAFTTPGDSNYVMVKYSFVNPGTNPISNFYVGLYGDFDISASGQQDKASWSAENKLGYTFDSNTGGLYAGIALLGDATPHYYAIDNDATAADTFGVYDGYSDTEKFRSISSGLYRRHAGVASAKDVSLAVGAGPYTIAPGDSIHVGFAIVAGENLQQIEEAADEAQDQWPLVTGLLPSKASIPSVKFYPNPVENELWIEGLSRLQVFGLDGKAFPVQTSNWENAFTKVDTRMLPPGIYQARLESGKSIRFVKK